MATTIYSSTTHNYWRAYMTYATNKTNTEYTVELSSYGVHANGGWFNYPDFTGTCSATGYNDTTIDKGRINISSGEKKAFNSTTKTFTWSRGTSSVDKTVKWKVTNGYLNKTSTVSHTFTVPALEDFTITFRKDGSTYATRTCYYGRSIGSSNWPANPSKTGYTFDGWYTDPTEGSKRTSSSDFTAADTLYAHWTPKQFTLTLNANGGSIDSHTDYWKGSGSTVTKTITYDKKYGVLPQSKVSRTGYEFLGWYTSASGGSKITEDSTVSVTSNQTLYAHWSAWTMTIKFNANGGTISDSPHLYNNYYYKLSSGIVQRSTSKSGTYSTFTQSIQTTDDYKDLFDRGTFNITKTGYTTTSTRAYNTSSDGTGVTISQINNGESDSDHTTNAATTKRINGGTQISSDVTKTIYLNWQPVTYDISYNYNGGTVTSSNRSSYTIETSSFTLHNPTKSNYTFSGWTGTGLSSKSTSVTISKGSYGDRSYTANWTPKVYTITLNNQSATSAGTSTVYAKYNTAWYSNSSATSSITSITKPTKTGYTFGGYYTGTQGSGTQIISANGNFLDNTPTTFTAADTLYAKWTINSYTLTLNANGGSIESYDGYWSGSGATVTKTKNYGATYGTLPSSSKITRTGYTLKGWYTTSSGSSTVTSNSTMGAANTTIYAQWTEITATLTYNNGGHGTLTHNSVTMSYTAATTADAGPSDAGNYKFSGWKSNSSTTIYSAGQQIKAKNTIPTAMTLTAQWVENAHILTLRANGGSIKNGSSWTSATTRTITTGSAYGTLPSSSTEIVYSNHILKGWYTSSSGGTEVSSSTKMGSVNATIFAQWIQEVYAPIITTLKAERGIHTGDTFTKSQNGTAVKITFKVTRGHIDSINSNKQITSSNPTSQEYAITIGSGSPTTGSYTNNTESSVIIDNAAANTNLKYNITFTVTDTYANSKTGTATKTTFVSGKKFIIDGYYYTNSNEVSYPRIGIGVEANASHFDGTAVSGWENNGVIKLNGITCINGNTHISGLVSANNTINGKQLTGNISLTAADVGAVSKTGGTISSASIWGSDSSYISVYGYNSAFDNHQYGLAAYATNVQLRDANGSGSIIWTAYTDKNKPTPNDIGAMPNSGGTLSNVKPYGSSNTKIGLVGTNSSDNIAYFLRFTGTSPVLWDNRSSTDGGQRAIWEGYTTLKKPTASDVGAISTSGGTITGALTVNGTLTTKSYIYLDNYTTFRGYKADKTNYVRMFYITQNDNLVVGNVEDAATYIYGSHVYLGNSSYPTSINGSSIAFNGTSLNNIITVTNITINPSSTGESAGVINGGNYIERSTTITNSGFYPKGIIGYNSSGDYHTWVFPYELFLSDRTDGSATLHYGLRNTSTSATSGYSLVVYVLWVKNPI